MDKDEKIVCSDMPADVEMASGNTEVIPSSGLKRELGSRHINMIAVAGMIGTGLFLSSGQVIATAGPVGALLAYTLMGFVTAGVAYTTGEITAFMPSTGGFVRHATKFVEPALGAATGWNFWYTMAINMPAEISAAATLVQFWNTSINPGVWITIFLLFIIVANLCGAKLYGESEVVFASLKIMLIIGLIIGGLVIDLGGAPNHERLGFRYWIHPGAFNTYIKDGSGGRFLAFWKAMLPAAFSYGNIQVVAISGSETRNPRKLIPAATKKTFYRIFFFYFCSIFIVGLIVPYNDPALGVSTGTASQSPFVIAFQRSGVSVVPSIINAVVCTSAISSGSACIFIASRTLFGLSCDGHAPKFFQRCNRFGTPHYAVGMSCLLSPLVYLTVVNNTSVVFSWFVNITTVAGLIGWVVIQVTYLRFFASLKKQGYSREELPYKSPFQPYVAWATLLMVSLVILFCGFDVFVKGHFTAQGFITCYINIAIFAVLYAIFKIRLRSKVIPTSQVELSEEFRSIRDEKQAEEASQRQK
ncbi:probable general amino acid permease [Fusarium mangiferae]|uniref:Probable general amino acid permease n=1 Tax=Fusarium mangiferae TaxID=192010 RepID=A0A1L7TLL5_FUSMA|nr:putative general amino acid permease [Fusarium mangiferae]CVK96167.1 probable general amino acid permease [Fusarium mangiferae]